MRIICSHQQVNDYNCSLYVIKNAWAIINCWDQSEVVRNAPQINTFNHLYNTVMQNWDQTEEEVAQLSQERTVRCSFELDSSARLQTSLLSKASSGMTTLPALSTLIRQLGSLNVISPQQELCRLERNKGCRKYWGQEVLIKRHNEDVNWTDKVAILSR